MAFFTALAGRGRYLDQRRPRKHVSAFAGSAAEDYERAALVAVRREALLYRELFEKYYPGQAEMVAGFWMPNRSWEGCDVDDPSARVLSNYGASGL